MRLNCLPAMLVVAVAAMIGGCGDNGSGTKPTPSSGGSSSTPPTSVTPVKPSGPVAGTGDSKPQIGMIPRGDGAVYWKALEAGAQKAVAEGKKGADGKPVLEIVWQDPAKTGVQVDAAKELVGKNVAAIVVVPEDEASLSGIVAAAGRIPVIAIGGEAKVEKVRSVIGADKAKASATEGAKVDAFGITKDDVAKLQAGGLKALVVADPVEIGAAAIKTASECMKEKKVEKRIDVAWRVITKETLTLPENAVFAAPGAER